MIYKTNEFICWKTENLGNGTTREIVTGNAAAEEERKEYFERRKELISNFKKNNVENYESLKQLNAAAWGSAYNTLWSEFGCCYYYCKKFVLNGIAEEEQEIFELVEEIISKNIDIVWQYTVKTIEVPVNKKITDYSINEFENIKNSFRQ